MVVLTDQERSLLEKTLRPPEIDPREAMGACVTNRLQRNGDHHDPDEGPHAREFEGRERPSMYTLKCWHRPA